MAEGYDYVIVGGGSAGCVLAARLSENPAAKVCLIEAGGRDTNPLIHMPVGFAKMTTGPLTWGLKTAPQKHANNREILYAQAKVLGGGSSAAFPPITTAGSRKAPRAGVLKTSRNTFCVRKAMRSSPAHGMGRTGRSASRIFPNRSA